MIVLKVIAGIIIALTLGLAILAQYFEPYNPGLEQITAADPQVAVPAAVPEVQRHRGAVNCKFDPITDSPQQFAADYLFGELLRQGNLYTFTARVAVPSSGYSASFGPISLAGTQAIMDANITRSNGAALSMIDTVGLQKTMELPLQALTLRVVLKRNFAWGPDAIICSIVRPVQTVTPATTAPVQPVPVAPALVEPAPAPVAPVPAPPVTPGAP